jgi:hypothetical protein
MASATSLGTKTCRPPGFKFGSARHCFAISATGQKRAALFFRNAYGVAKVPEAAGPWEDAPPLNERKPELLPG